MTASVCQRTSDRKGERKRVAEQSGAMEPRKTAERWIARFLPKAKMAPDIKKENLLWKNEK